MSVCNICARFSPNAQYMHKIVLIFPMRNICARFVQNCTSFPNVQYMRKICARLYLFPLCAIYVQDLCKIVLLSPMCNICTRLYLFLKCARFAQDCTSFSNAQYMRKIVLLSPMCKDCRHYWNKYVTYQISALNLEWYSLHKVGSHDPIFVQLSFQIFLCMMKNVGVHTIQFSHPIIS